jgi:hypothetical protein
VIHFPRGRGGFFPRPARDIGISWECPALLHALGIDREVADAAMSNRDKLGRSNEKKNGFILLTRCAIKICQETTPCLTKQHGHV